MTVGFVDIEQLSTDDLREGESITKDHTIGLIRAQLPEHLRGQVLFDLRRLRRAILAFEEEFDEELAEIGIVEDPDTPGPILVLAPDGGSDRAIGLACRSSEDSGFRWVASEEFVEDDS